MALTEQQRDEIRQRLEAGMTPEAIALSIGRIADLDDIEIEEIRAAAREMSLGE